MKNTAYFPDRIFTGETFIHNQAVLIQDGKVVALVPQNALPEDIDCHRLPGKTLAPAFMDLQIYGGLGQMFSLTPSVDSLDATYRYCMQGGAAYFMATVATNSPKIMQESMKAVNQYWAEGRPGLLGLHLEGPYLNPAKKGAHLPQYIIEHPSLQEVKALVESSAGALRMITIAPECCSEEVIRYLLDQGILVSAGHSNATYEEAEAAFALGIPTATHLYNAMSPLQHRAPGLVGALFDGTACSSLVADGIHVSFPAVRIAQKIMGPRLFLITDAVTEARSDSYTYILKEDRYVTENGTLAGSCLTQAKSVQNLVHRAGIPEADALRMASLYPARVIGRDHELGMIREGFRADWVVLDEQLNPFEMILDGTPVTGS
jgi:N-acetylglucosamine-6-phosphate deacetylase